MRRSTRPMPTSRLPTCADRRGCDRADRRSCVVLVVGGSWSRSSWWRGSVRSLRAELAEQRRIADAVEAEAAAERAQADETRLRLVQALDAIPQGVLIADADGQVVVRNRVADDVRRRPPQRRARRGGHRRAARRRAERPRGASARSTCSGRPDGRWSSPPRPLPDGALVVVDDISERRRLEATRRDFVANISHELKTPVGAMGLLAETLLAEDDRQVASRLAERIVNEAFRLDRTIEDLLVLSRIEGEEIAAHEPVRGPPAGGRRGRAHPPGRRAGRHRRGRRGDRQRVDATASWRSSAIVASSCRRSTTCSTTR